MLLAVIWVLLYRDPVARDFEYSGFIYQDPSLPKLIASLCLIGILALGLPQKLRWPSDIFAWLFFLIVVIPSLTIPLMTALKLESTLFVAISLMVSIAQTLFVSVPRLPIAVGVRSHVSAQLFWTCFFLLLAAFVLVLLVDFRAGLSRLTSLTSYSEIYSLRFSYREQASSGFAVAPYFLLWCAKVLIPLLLTWAMVRKRWFLLVFAVFLQLLMFSISGHKSFILSLALVTGTLWLYRAELGGVLFLTAILVVTLLAAMIYYLFDNTLLVHILLRRAFMVPGMLTGFYYEYFSNEGFAFYSHSFADGLVYSGYERSPAFQIGRIYFGRDETSANANFWADAYANLGHIATILATSLLVFILKFINCLAEKRERLMVVGVSIVPMWTLLESSLQTTLISHGLVLALLLAVTLPRQEDRSSVNASINPV